MTGPRLGSRPSALLAIKVGKSALFQAPKGRVGVLMQQISTDMQRNGLSGLMSQRHLIAVDPATHEVMDIVCVSRVRGSETK